MADAKVKTTITSNSAQERADNEKRMRSIDKVAEKLQKQVKVAKRGTREAISDGRKKVAAVKREAAALRKLEAQQRRVTSAQRRQRRLLGGARRVAGALAGGGAALVALRLVTSELEKQREIESKALDVQLNLNKARANLIRNLEPRQAREAIASATRIARQAALPEGVIANALAQTLSGVAGNLPLAIASVQGATKFIPDQPGLLPLIAGAIADMSKVTRSMDAVVNTGFFKLIAQRGRLVDPLAQAQTVPGALTNLVASGGTAQEAAALFTTISVGATDVQGRRTRTAIVRLVEQIRKDFPQLVGKTITEQIFFLQKNPEFGQKFVDENDFEKAMVGVLRQLLTDPTSRPFQQFSEDLKFFEGGNARFREAGLAAQKALADSSLDATVSIAKLTRAFDSATEQIRIGNIEGATRSAVRKGTAEIIEAAQSQTSLGRGLEKLRFEKQTRGKTALEIADLGVARLEAFQRRRAELGTSGSFFGGDSPRTEAEVVAEREKTELVLKELRRNAARLGLEEFRKNNPETVDNTQALKDNTAAMQNLTNGAGGRNRAAPQRAIPGSRSPFIRPPLIAPPPPRN